jgi:hypothetical protein
MIVDHYAAAGRDELRVAAIYSDDVILDFPKGESAFVERRT